MNDIITKLEDCQRSNVLLRLSNYPTLVLASSAPLVAIRAPDTIEKSVFSEGGCKSKKERKRFGLGRNHEDAMGKLET